MEQRNNEQNSVILQIDGILNKMSNQVNFLIRNNKLMNQLDVDLLMENTRKLYDTLCSVKCNMDVDSIPMEVEEGLEGEEEHEEIEDEEDEDLEDDFESSRILEFESSIQGEYEEFERDFEEDMEEDLEGEEGIEDDEELEEQEGIEDDEELEDEEDEDLEDDFESSRVLEFESSIQEEYEEFERDFEEDIEEDLEDLEDEEGLEDDEELEEQEEQEEIEDEEENLESSKVLEFEDSVPEEQSSVPEEQDSGIRSYKKVYTIEPQTLCDKLESAEDNSLAARLQRKPVADLASAIGINDKFLLLNELFGGSMEKYNKSIRALNNFSTLLGAKTYMSELQIEFQWNCESDAYKKLDNLVERRFM